MYVCVEIDVFICVSVCLCVGIDGAHPPSLLAPYTGENPEQQGREQVVLVAQKPPA